MIEKSIEGIVTTFLLPETQISATIFLWRIADINFHWISRCFNRKAFLYLIEIY